MLPGEADSLIDTISAGLEEGNVKIIPNSNGGVTIQLKTWNGIDETKIEPGSFEVSLYVGLKSEFDNKNK